MLVLNYLKSFADDYNSKKVVELDKEQREKYIKIERQVVKIIEDKIKADFNGVIDLKGYDIKSMIEIGEAIIKAHQEFPLTFKNIREIRTDKNVNGGGRMTHYTDGSCSILLDAKYDLSKDNTHIDSTNKGLFNHEFGHYLYDDLIKFEKGKDEIKNYLWKKSLLNAKNVSERAMASEFEFVAECHSGKCKGVQLEILDGVYEILKAEYNKKYGGKK